MKRVGNIGMKAAYVVASVAIILIVVNFTVFPQSFPPSKLFVYNNSASTTFTWHSNNNESIQGAFARLPVVVSYFHRGNGSPNSTLTLSPWFGSNYWLPQNGTYSNGSLIYGVLGYINGSVLQNMRPTSITLLVDYNNNTTSPIYGEWVEQGPSLAPMPYNHINVSNLNAVNYSKDVHYSRYSTSVTPKLLNTTNHAKDYYFSFPFEIILTPAAINRTNYNVIDIFAYLNGLGKNVSAEITLTVVDLWE